MEHPTIWSRVGQWFKSAGARQDDGDNLPGLSQNGFLDHSDDSSDPAGEARGLSRRRQREAALERLEEGYQQVAKLLDSIHQHLESQDNRSAQVVQAMNSLAQTTARICEAADAQTEKLGLIAGHLNAGNDRARRWEQTLFEMPKLADAQREALSAISRELQAGKETDQHLARTLDGFRDAVTSWGESSAASTEALRDLKHAAAQRDDSLNGLISAQSRRFVWLFVVTLVLAAAAVGTGIVALAK